jgi:outer membrane protein
VKKHLFLLIITAFAANAFGQTGSGNKQLVSLDQAIKLALEKNYSTRTASLDLQRSELEKTKSKDALLPSLSGDASYQYSQQITRTNIYDSLFNVVGKDYPDKFQSVSYGVGGNLNLYAGGGDASRIESANRSLDASKYTLKWTRQSIALDVTRAYVNALRTRELVVTSEKTLEQTKAQLERIRGLFQAGSVPIGQVYQQEAQLGQQELDLITATNDFDNAKADLLYVLNVSANAYDKYDITANGIDTSVSSLKARTATMIPKEEEIQGVINSREDFAATRSSIMATEAAIGITRSALLPRLDANFGVSGNGGKNNLNEAQMRNQYYAGLGLSVPLFDRMQNRISIEQQEIDIETSRIRLEQQEQQYRSDIAKAMNAVRSADRAVDAAQRGLRAAEESLRSAEERYRVGAGTQTDVIVAQATIQNARTSNVNAVYSLLYAQKVLEYQLGRWNY